MTAIIITVESKTIGTDTYIGVTTHQPTENRHTTNCERNAAKLIKAMCDVGIHDFYKTEVIQGVVNMTTQELEKLIEEQTKELYKK